MQSLAGKKIKPWSCFVGNKKWIFLQIPPGCTCSPRRLDNKLQKYQIMALGSPSAALQEPLWIWWGNAAPRAAFRERFEAFEGFNPNSQNIPRHTWGRYEFNCNSLPSKYPYVTAGRREALPKVFPKKPLHSHKNIWILDFFQVVGPFP